MERPGDTDVLIAGGGLAGSLLALALATRRPELRVTLVDPGERLGGNHLWSFFDSDIAPDMRWLTDPLVSRHWDGHAVRFPAFDRVLPGGYNSILSERLDERVRAALPPDRIVRGVVTRLAADGADLADGRRIAAGAVIDARGFAGSGENLSLGWQKFAGLMLRLAAPHGLARPMIMDATVDQAEGYRFVYLLPFDDRRVFVEDTYYSTSPAIDAAEWERRIGDYALSQGWTVEAIERREAAALPIVMAGDLRSIWDLNDLAVGRIGMAAALFHPMTGYSLPDAIETARIALSVSQVSSIALATAFRAHAEARWRERGFYRLLARMLFRAAEPADRYRLLERFYRLHPALIARFYAGRSTLADKARVLVGKPPVPLRRALAAIRER